MSENDRPDVLIIGAGPGGYVAAIKAAQLGLRTVVVEREEVGGVCLNWGCIPSKAVIHAAGIFQKAQKAESMGISCSGVALDMAKMTAWKDGIVKRLTGGIATLLKANKAELVRGEARFASANRVEVTSASGTRTFEPKNVIVATGATPIQLPGLEVGEHVLGAREALALKTLPRRLVVVGGGVIGLELGTAFAKLGSEVTVVELLDTVLYGTEPDMTKWVTRKLKKLKVKVMTRCKVASYKQAAGELHVEVTDKDGKDPKTIVADKILCSIGFRPNSKGFGLEEIGVALDKRGHVTIDDQCRTNVPSIYAIGDVTGAPYLAHKASKEGIVAAEVIAGKPSALDYRALPAAIFTDPEIATVGYTQEKAKADGYETKVGKFPFSALGRSQTLGQTPVEGFCRLVVEKDSGVLLGAQIVGYGASDLIAELALGIEMGALAEDIALTIHAHPTLPEAIIEAAEAAVHGKSIHAL
ncbi:MAG: dihydrolipoyl dehydrogenase [Planctomycetota bacterium]|jgi:dihydrolipoamide dehydrogenase